MGINCCSEDKNSREFDQEVVIGKSPIKKKAGSVVPLDDSAFEETQVSLKSTKSYDVAANKNYQLVDFPLHGRSKPEDVQTKTRVVKRGKKVRR